MEYELTQYDKDFIARLYEIDDEILDLYNKMADLEIKGVDFLDEEFQKLISELKNLVSIENSIINLETFTLPRLNVLMAYNLNLRKNNIESGEIKDSYSRILNILLIEWEKAIKDKTNVINNSIDSDVRELTIYFGNDLIKDSRYKKYRDYIVKYIKYDSIFSDKKLEIKFIENNFVVEKDAYISSDLISEYLKIDQKSYDNFKLKLLLDKILFHSKVIVSAPDDAFEIDDILKILLLSKCFLKSAVVMLPKNEFDEIYNAILTRKNTENSKSHLFLKEIFEESLEDRKRINNVSFGRNRS